MRRPFAPQVLEADGHSLTAPQERKGLHPLVRHFQVHIVSSKGLIVQFGYLKSAAQLIPLGRKGPIHTCLLRWPDNGASRVRPPVPVSY